MAFYDIAARQQRISPVQEMLQSRAQRDAHEINQLNIEKSEIQMPYVKQLTEQRVRQNELAIKEAETRMPFLEQQLEAQKTLTDQQIEQNALLMKKAKRQEDFYKALANPEIGPETLEKTYPEEWLNWETKNVESTLQQMRQFDATLASFKGMDDEQARQKWGQLVARAPDNIKPFLGEYSRERVLGLEQALQRGQRTQIDAIMGRIEYYTAMHEKYPDRGYDEMAQAMLSYLQRMTVGRGTQTERLADQLFPNSDTPLLDTRRFYEIQDIYESSLRSQVSSILKMDPTDQYLLAAQGKEQFLGLAKNESQRRELQATWDNIEANARQSVERSYGEGMYDWYLDAKQDQNERFAQKARKEREARAFRQSTTEGGPINPSQPDAPPPYETPSRDSQYTTENPAKPTTQAEFDALEPGDAFINPADGKVKIKE